MGYIVNSFVKSRLICTEPLSFDAFQTAYIWTKHGVDFDLWLESLVDSRQYHYSDENIEFHQLLHYE